MAGERAYDFATPDEERAITTAFLNGACVSGLAHAWDCDQEAIEEILRANLNLRRAAPAPPQAEPAPEDKGGPCCVDRARRGWCYCGSGRATGDREGTP